MLLSINTFLREQGIDAGVPFFIAVSGGVDSMVLSHLCVAQGMAIKILHCHFGLRGAESNADALFVQQWAQQLDVPCQTQHFDVTAYQMQHGGGIQEAARILRYQWFDELAAQQNSYYLLAHQQDDVAETVLMNLSRGTGLHGLTGMATRTPSGRGLRPLLNVSREQIMAYAKANQLTWREDSSNSKEAYTRNFFRLRVIPLLQKVHAQAAANITATANRLEETEALYQPLVQALKKKLSKTEGPDLRYPVKQLLAYRHTALGYEILKDYHFEPGLAPQFWALCSADSGRFIKNEHFQIVRHRHWLVISPLKKEAQTVSIDATQSRIDFAGGTLYLKEVDVSKITFGKNECIAFLDAAQLRFPLLLRPFRTADYFYPLGMAKKKKLARFFIDLKLSKAQKERVWVLESGGRIAWLLGLRIDDRFKIKPYTKKAWQLTLSNP